jgi:hypothetical protein
MMMMGAAEKDATTVVIVVGGAAAVSRSSQVHLQNHIHKENFYTLHHILFTM